MQFIETTFLLLFAIKCNLNAFKISQNINNNNEIKYVTRYNQFAKQLRTFQNNYQKIEVNKQQDPFNFDYATPYSVDIDENYQQTTSTLNVKETKNQYQLALFSSIKGDFKVWHLILIIVTTWLFLVVILWYFINFIREKCKKRHYNKFNTDDSKESILQIITNDSIKSDILKNAETV